MMASCDSPQQKSIRELGKAGIEPSGKSLTEAVARRDAKVVGWLLDAGVHTEHRDADNRTPLRVTVDQGSVEMAIQLIDHKANVNSETPDKTTVLGAAVERGQAVIVERLLAAGARADGVMSDGEKILPWSIREGRLTFVRAMMKAGADPHMRDNEGNPLLQVAIKHGHRDLAESLMEFGADPGAVSPSGVGTLELAIRQGWYDWIPRLAQAGADPNTPCFEGRTPLEHALRNRDFTLLSCMLQAGADANQPSRITGQSSLESVIMNGEPRVLEIFLQHGSKPDHGNWEPWLWQAYAHGNRPIAQLLLTHGAHGNSRNAQGQLLVEAAANARDGDFVKLLLDYGCPVGQALDRAVASGELDMVKLLVSCGARYDTPTPPSAEAPLAIAVRCGHDDVAVFLLEKGGDANVHLSEDQPLFLMAIATGCPRTVDILLKRGANPNMAFNLPVSDAFLNLVRPGVIRWVLKNDKNVTPLMVAVDSGVVETARQLLRAGAKTETWTRRSQLWPINFASRRNDVAMMRLILGKDPIKETRQIIIRLSEQKACLYDASGTELFTTSVSTGKKGYGTPTGEYVITNKHRDWTSTLYHASMPFFQRLNCSDFGLHQGVVPGYPASHGCIRVPAGNAAKLFAMTEAGDRVRIIP